MSFIISTFLIGAPVALITLPILILIYEVISKFIERRRFKRIHMKRIDSIGEHLEALEAKNKTNNPYFDVKPEDINHA